MAFRRSRKLWRKSKIEFKIVYLVKLNRSIHGDDTKIIWTLILADLLAGTKYIRHTPLKVFIKLLSS